MLFTDVEVVLLFLLFFKLYVNFSISFAESFVACIYWLLSAPMYEAISTKIDLDADLLFCKVAYYFSTVRWRVFIVRSRSVRRVRGSVVQLTDDVRPFSCNYIQVQANYYSHLKIDFFFLIYNKFQAHSIKVCIVRNYQLNRRIRKRRITKITSKVTKWEIKLTKSAIGLVQNRQ